MAKQVSFEEFSKKVANLDVDDSELASYFRNYSLEGGAEATPDTMGPDIRFDPEMVDIEDIDDPRAEAAVLFKGANTLARARREIRFIRAVRDKQKKDRPVLVTEGDSWFQFPFLLKDVVDHLSDHFNVYSVGAAGDTTKNMIFKNPEYLLAIAKAREIANRPVNGFVFSSGGNDILGKEGEDRVLQKMVRPHNSGESVDLNNAYNIEAMEKQFDLIAKGYRHLVASIRAIHPDLPIFFHTYDEVWPFNPEDPADGRKGLWIQPSLSAQGVTAFADQRKITSDLITRFQQVLAAIAQEDTGVHVVDTGQPLADKLELWYDEIHPNSDGYARVALKFKETIDKVLSLQA